MDFGMDVQEAVDAPRIHQQWQPETTPVERFALSPDTRRVLIDMGHKFTESGPGARVLAKRLASQAKHFDACLRLWTAAYLIRYFG
jgi:gamma-glutamyltranspeptidase